MEQEKGFWSQQPPIESPPSVERLSSQLEKIAAELGYVESLELLAKREAWMQAMQTGDKEAASSVGREYHDLALIEVERPKIGDSTALTYAQISISIMSALCQKSANTGYYQEDMAEVINHAYNHHLDDLVARIEAAMSAEE